MRYFQLDFLRGLMLVIMTIDHLKSPISKFTLSPFGFFSSAMGFVFLSGLVAGIVAQNKADKPLSRLTNTFHQRAFKIFRYHVASYLIVYFVGFLFYHQGEVFNIFNNFDLESPVFVKLIFGVFLLDKPKYLDILPMYFLFVLFLPVIIQLVERKKDLYLIAISGVVYILAQIFNTYQYQKDLSQSTWLELGGFDLIAWQFIFILGVVLGMLYKQGHMQFLQDKKIMIFTAFLILCTTLLRRHELFAMLLPADVSLQIETFVKMNLSNFGELNPVQLLNFICFAVLLYNLIHFGILKLSNRWLTLLGQHSLYVFTFHIFLSYGGLMLRENMFDLLSGRQFFLFDLFITGTCIIILFLFVYYRSNKINKKKLKIASSQNIGVMHN